MDVKAERVNPYRGDTRCKTEQVRDMFDSIAPAYDFMNRMMTFGIDRLWRRKAVRMLASGPHADILDVATACPLAPPGYSDRHRPERRHA